MSRGAPSWWWIAALGLAAVQLPVLVRTGGDPGQSDFANYYTPARVLARGGDVGALYDRDSFAAAMTDSGLSGLGSFIPHPPANALWLLPFASFSAASAKGMWSTVLVVSLVLTVFALSRSPPGLEASKAAVIVLAPTLAIRNDLAFGQPYLVLAALLGGGVLALDGKRDVVAGLLLGLGVSFKPYAIAVGLLLLRRDRLRAFAGFIAGALLPSLAVIAISGVGPFVEFATKVLPWMVRGEIQDPFSPAWGSVSALSNRLFRYEPDLNPLPLVAAPIAARFLAAAVSAALLATGVFAGRRAMASGRPAEAVAVVIAFALAASPFAASYHLVLLSVTVAVVARRLRGAALVTLVAGFAVLGSPVVNQFRGAEGFLTPLAFVRLFGIVAVAIVASWSFLDRRVIGAAMAVGALCGAAALREEERLESWPRVERARGYSMMRPYFCGASLRWFSPSADGRRLESRGEGEDCVPERRAPSSRRGLDVVSEFTSGSWNLYLRGAGRPDIQLTHSRANEIDPVSSHDGCSVVFASDQGRGLGSTALYRLDLKPFIEGCAGAAPASGPR
jgi:hypothetical protein